MVVPKKSLVSLCNRNQQDSDDLSDVDSRRRLTTSRE